ncbi:MAG: hypothetical protein JWL89_370, partial [Candidatus Saccharibacteria bacterium]|nr:hypothetical protein [Candidatus Saccharibacteria bacterium]
KKQGNSYGPENKWVPTKVFEQSGTIYITATYFYSLSNSFNLPHGGLGFKTCEKIEKSFSTVDDRMSSRPSDYTAFEVLPLYIGNASNLTEINTFLRQKIWENYKVAKLTDGPTNEWQEVELGLIDENDSGGQGKTVIRYYPSRQKVIAWSIGQHNHYVNPSGNNDDTDYVQQMVDSLKFD